MSRPLVVEFDVSASVERARRFVIDEYFHNHCDWDAGLDELVPDGDGTVMPGARGREVRSFFGRQETSFEIVDASARHLVLVDGPSVWQLRRQYEIDANGGGARVRFTFDMTPRAAWFRMAFPILRPVIHRQVRANMRRLASLLEGVGVT